MEKERIAKGSVKTTRFFAVCLFAYMRTIGFDASVETRWLDVLRVVQMDQQANSLTLANLLNDSSSSHSNPLDSGTPSDLHLSTDIALRKEDKHLTEQENEEEKEI